MKGYTITLNSDNLYVSLSIIFMHGYCSTLHNTIYNIKKQIADIIFLVSCDFQ